MVQVVSDQSYTFVQRELTRLGVDVKICSTSVSEFVDLIGDGQREIDEVLVILLSPITVLRVWGAQEKNREICVSGFAKWLKQIVDRRKIQDNSLVKVGIIVREFSFSRVQYLDCSEDIDYAGVKILCADLNRVLWEMSRVGAIDVITQDDFVDQDGLRRALKHLVRTGYYESPEDHLAIAKVIHESVQNKENTTPKVFFVDFDNTLWGGIIAEDAENVAFGRQSQSGYYYWIVQRLLKRARDQGCILVGVTKNEMEDVKSFFDARDDLLLTISSFTLLYASWRDKSESISDALRRLDLAARDCVFIDDSSHECGEVQSVHNEIQVLDFRGDVNDLIYKLNIILRKGGSVTSEDKRRAEMYEARLSREVELNRAENKESWLKSLNTKVSVCRQSAKDLDARVIQLFQRSNQFNQNGRRLDAHYILGLLERNYECITSSLEDRHGAEGIVLSCLFRTERDSIVVEDLCMSCRVLGRSVELVTLLVLMQEAKASSIYVRYRDTQRNGRYKEFVKAYMIDGYDKSIVDELEYAIIELDREKMLQGITVVPSIEFSGKVKTLTEA